MFAFVFLLLLSVLGEHGWGGWGVHHTSPYRTIQTIKYSNNHININLLVSLSVRTIVRAVMENNSSPSDQSKLRIFYWGCGTQ